MSYTAQPRDYTLNYVRINQKHKVLTATLEQKNKLDLIIKNVDLGRKIGEITVTKSRLKIGEDYFPIEIVAPILNNSFFNKKHNSILNKYKTELFNFIKILDFNIFKESNDYFISFTSKSGPFTFETFIKETLVHLTGSFEWVRSKSESIIAETLLNEGIEYEFETIFIGQTGVYFRPDFTIEVDKSSYYWEHAGRMDKEEYKKKLENKIKGYEGCLIKEGGGKCGTLILTKETEKEVFTAVDAKYKIDSCLNTFNIGSWVYDEGIYIKQLDNKNYYFSEYNQEYRELFISERKVKDTITGIEKDTVGKIEVDNQKIYLYIRDDYSFKSLIAFTLVILELVYKKIGKYNFNDDEIKIRCVYLDNKVGSLSIAIDYMYIDYDEVNVNNSKMLKQELFKDIQDGNYYLVHTMDLILNNKKVKEFEFPDNLLNDIHYHDKDAWWLGYTLDTFKKN